MTPLDSGGHPVKKGWTRKRDDESPPPTTSYSQAVKGGPPDDATMPEDHPVDIEEGDITQEVGENEGSITLSQQLRSKLDQQWSHALVVKKSGAVVDDASPSNTIGAGATETSNGYGPWTNVQRRHPRPSVKGRPHTGDSASRGVNIKEGSKFAALTSLDAGLEPAGHPRTPPTGQLEGLGQWVQVGASSGSRAFQFKGALGRQSTQARKATQASKGKSVIFPPLARNQKGQTSVVSAFDVTNFLPIQLQPTAKDRNLAVVLPTHSEMVCDRQLIAVPDQGSGEQTPPLVGVEESGTRDGLPKLPPTGPSDISMTSSGPDDNPGLHQDSRFDPTPQAMESSEPRVESSTVALR
ncbi:hypothetical protein K2173_021383 [Erythroxylum novogranatense]|uniref:Uncharacterized protein n=1 Tax=Erythroxylum novogranatense TaxID=1862640 RepID=A0AAV8TUV4_9ROSI|nr:hypothetical protein K2173_021383 [Erythroxylum novogranatense]